jgi:DNA-binding transcriptional regulator YhcF (GntR family)
MAQQQANPFATDRDDELPVGVQLGWRLRALIATGRLAAGERLPSFRRLAGWAGVNLNTVRAVYEGLEAEGLVVSRQGQGTFVAEGVDATPELEEIASEALRRVREAGLSPRELAVVAMACASMEAENETLEVRHELRRQIARLEAELAAYMRDLNVELPTAPRWAEPHVAGVQELEQTRDTLIAQLSEAQKAAELRVQREAAGPLGKAMSWWRAKP